MHNAANIQLNPNLCISVSDPDLDSMNVYFYNASSDDLIGSKTNIASGSTTSITWSNLNYNTVYSWYVIADDGEDTAQSDTWVFTTKQQVVDINNPPDKPDTPIPSNNSVDVGINPSLSVLVKDFDDDMTNVTFYNASDDSIIGTDINVVNNSRAEVQWSNLAYDTTYHWYAICNDSEFETKSDIWTFKTRNFTNSPPNITITKPQNNSVYLFNLIRIPRISEKIFIIGAIQVQVDVEDDIGVEKVEYYLGSEETPKYTATDDPYSWMWDEQVFGRHKITAIVYDEDGLTDTDYREVFIINLNLI